MSKRKPRAEIELEELQRVAFSYFLHEVNPVNGLVLDKTAENWPASIAAVGLALAAYPVAVERGFMSRAAAVERTVTTLRFFWTSSQGSEPDEHCIHELKLTLLHPYGFKATFNPTFPQKSGSPYGWVSPWHYGLNQGPIILMIENYRTGLLWQLMRQCPYIVKGLRRAGFAGGWL